MSRYPALFDTLAHKNEGAFVPFVMLGDPTINDSYSIIEALIAGGADALELGIPFSDPVADGVTIQEAHLRALHAEVHVNDALGLVQRIRAAHPDLPIGLLIYGNVAFARGLEQFYADVAAAGADSVLIPDVPTREGADFIAAADKAGIDQIFIAPPHARKETLEEVARYSRGYIYAVSRAGVTGTERVSETEGLSDIVTQLDAFQGAPVLLGFGISTPEHVRQALEAGARGAICGSAITKIIESHCVQAAAGEPSTLTDPEQLFTELRDFVSSMKEATKQ